MCVCVCFGGGGEVLQSEQLTCVKLMATCIFVEILPVGLFDFESSSELCTESCLILDC